MSSGTTVWACGVLEGGGAKGAAYGPALQALEERSIRFSSVAGSSAGALTAALIAAGCTAEEIGNVTLEALNILAPPRFGHLTTARWAAKGFRLEPPRVRSIDKLEKLVERVLRDKLGAPQTREQPVTFLELQSRDNPIELFVVAVDAIGKREWVFHHALDPQQSVANAAVASAAIPLYFPPGKLNPTEDEAQPWSRILFDGGVWSNYPAWIYKDPSFREHHRRKGRQLTRVSDKQDGSREHPVILGLLLDEESEARGATATVGSSSLARPPGAVARGTGALWKLVLGALLAFTSPIYLFGLAYFLVAVGSTVGCLEYGGRFCTVQANMPDGTFDTAVAPPITAGRVALVLAVLAFIYQYVRLQRRKRSGAFITKMYGQAETLGSVGGVALILFADRLASAHVETRPQLSKPAYSWLADWPRSDAIAVGALSIAAIVAFLTIFAVAVAAPAAQGMGRKVMFVLTSAGSARYWVGADDNDHAVKIPVKGLDTLSFGEARRFVDDYSSGVREVVARQVDEILAIVRRRS